MILIDRNKNTIEAKESTVVFDSEISSETVIALIAELESLDCEIVNLYWSSVGGSLHTLLTLVDFVKNHSKFYNIRLSGFACSAGLGFLLMVRNFENVCITNVLSASVVMAHQTSIELSKRDLCNKNTQSYHMTVENEADKIWNEMHKDLLSAREMEEFERGLDVYILNSRLRSFLEIDENVDNVYREKLGIYMSGEMDSINVDTCFLEDVEEINEEEIVEELQIADGKVRGFEPVGDTYLTHPEVDYQKPVRATKNSAGYDLFSTKTITIGPKERVMIPTDVKAYMLEDEVLKLYVRSSAGIKKGLALQNGTGVIDSDYYSNPSNDGNIGIPLVNNLDYPVEIKVGERIAQGVFMKYLVVDNDDADGERVGGTGSTGVA